MHNIDYFDDVVFQDVNRVVSRRDGLPSPCHDFWGIGLMLGSGYVMENFVSGQQQCCKMPFLYLIHPSPGGGFWSAVNGTERENRWFVMKGPRAERIVKSLDRGIERRDSANIPLKSHQDLTAIHQKMLHIYQRGLPSLNYQLTVCLEEFVGAICSALRVTHQNSRVLDFVAKIADKISTSPGEEYDFPRLARSHRISYDHFRRRFQEYAGKAVYDFLLEKRLSLAENLLRDSSDSIKEISVRCGFPRQAEFARFVKHRTGLTPSEMRKRPNLDTE